MFKDLYKNTTVLVTGHTGFKGSWLSLWLNELGAKVIGYSLPSSTQPNHFDLLKLNMTSIIGNIRNKKKLIEVLKTYRPKIVFHLAAQPLVRYSYKNPLETFETNLMGTLNLFESCRNSKSVKAILNVTSDKCYQNNEQKEGYRETDPMGGFDPYSASKGCSELLTQSYRNSFFNLNDYEKSHCILLASARAGNVIGGGDWSQDRLIPDIVKATSQNKKVFIRSPMATRPWQHVLEPLSGYLFLGQKLLEEKKEFAQAWNFGPNANSTVTVQEVLTHMRGKWDQIQYAIEKKSQNYHEASLLKLNCRKANSILKWNPIWNLKKTVSWTTSWYRDFYECNQIKSLENLQQYYNDASSKNLPWTH